MDLFLFNTQIVAACILIFLSFGLVGAQIAHWIGLAPISASLNPLYGWAVSIVLTLALAPWLSGGALIAFLILLCFAGFLMLTKHKLVAKTLPITYFLGALVLLPLLYGLCDYPVREWDDMSHWLPNAHFLFQYGRFPATGGPVAYSAWPAYPYAYTGLIAAVGWVVGKFVENVGPLINITLLILLASFVAEKIDGAAKNMWRKLRMFSVVLLLFTVINPAFDTVLLFSAYGEYATAVIFAFLLYLGWQIALNPQRGLALSFALLAIVFIQIKQSNIFLLVLLAGSLWITSPTNKKRILITLLLSLVPALIINGLWEMYKSQHLAGLAFTFKPFHDWQWNLLPALLQAMGHVAIEKIGYFAMLIGLLIWGGTSLFKKRDEMSQLVMAFTLIALGHFAFLTLAYIGSRFSHWEITSAASFFRYMTHLQCAATMIILFKLGEIIHRDMEPAFPTMRKLGTIMVLAIPIAGISMSAFNWYEQPMASIQATRDYAKQAFTKLPAQGKIGLIGTRTNGLENTMIRFQWCLMASPERQPELTGYVTQYSGETTPEAVRHFAERYDAVMVAPNDELAAKALGQPTATGWASYLRQDDHWSKILD